MAPEQPYCNTSWVLYDAALLTCCFSGGVLERTSLQLFSSTVADLWRGFAFCTTDKTSGYVKGMWMSSWATFPRGLCRSPTPPTRRSLTTKKVFFWLFSVIVLRWWVGKASWTYSSLIKTISSTPLPHKHINTQGSLDYLHSRMRRNHHYTFTASLTDNIIGVSMQDQPWHVPYPN